MSPSCSLPHRSRWHDRRSTPHHVTGRIELLRYGRVSSTSGSVGVANFHGIRDASRGWVNYFAVGHSSRCFGFVRDWVEKKIRRHLMRARKPRGFGWKRWSRRWLYDTLGLFNDYRVRSHALGAAGADQSDPHQAEQCADHQTSLAPRGLVARAPSDTDRAE